MTRVDFHFNTPDKLAYACRLIRKILRSGGRSVVFADRETIGRLDQALWTFSELDFIPHVRAGDPLAAQTPVVLCSDAVETPHWDVLVNLAPATPPFFSRFERLIELVGTDAEDRARARDRWRFYKDRGYPLESHDLAAAR